MSPRGRLPRLVGLFQRCHQNVNAETTRRADARLRGPEHTGGRLPTLQSAAPEKPETGRGRRPAGKQAGPGHGGNWPWWTPGAPTPGALRGHLARGAGALSPDPGARKGPSTHPHCTAGPTGALPPQRPRPRAAAQLKEEAGRSGSRPWTANGAAHQNVARERGGVGHRGGEDVVRRGAHVGHRHSGHLCNTGA